MKLDYINKQFFSFSLYTGFSVAFLLTLIITLWEWLENPSGIFHNQNGTNWRFVFDTSISWFIPTFINVVLIAAAGHLLFSFIKRRL